MVLVINLEDLVSEVPNRDQHETLSLVECTGAHLVYGSRPTPLVGTTRARHQLAIDGRDVLVTQVSRQFRLMTGKDMPIPQVMKIL